MLKIRNLAALLLVSQISAEEYWAKSDVQFQRNIPTAYTLGQVESSTGSSTDDSDDEDADLQQGFIAGFDDEPYSLNEIGRMAGKRAKGGKGKGVKSTKELKEKEKEKDEKIKAEI